MPQTPESLSDFERALSSSAVEIADDLEVILRDYKLFKHFSGLLTKYLNDSDSESIVLSELIDCIDSRLDCHLDNLRGSVNKLRKLLGHND
jgi:hypothetical protein